MPNVVKFAQKGGSILIRRFREQGVKTTLLWMFARGLPKITGVPIKEYSRITPEIFVGAQYGPAGKRKLAEWGVNGDVNMRIEFDDAAHGLALEHYCYLPTPDDHAPSLAHLAEGAAFIRRVVDGGGKVYIHCAGGIGRAPTMAAAYFISRGMPLAEAVSLIQQTRAFINIMPAQMTQLKVFESLQTNGKN